MVYLVEWNDGDGDILDRSIYCNVLCADQDPATDMANTEQGYWPGGWESDHNEYCPSCGTMLTHGMTEEECNDPQCTDCPPLVINLVTPYDEDQVCENCGCVQYLGKEKL